MKLALSVEVDQDDQLILAQQLGVDQVFVETTKWEVEALASLANRVSKAGLCLGGCAWPDCRKGPAGSVSRRPEPETVEGLCQAITAAGRAGIPQISVTWWPVGPGDSETGLLVRAAEAAAVRLAWRCPGDGASSDAGDPGRSSTACGLELSLEFCESTSVALQVIRDAGERIFSVLLANHRGVQRCPCALNAGDLEIPAVLRALADRGYSGSIRAVKGPEIVADTTWGHKRRAFDVGYLRAALQALGSSSARRREHGGTER